MPGTAPLTQKKCEHRETEKQNSTCTRKSVLDFQQLFADHVKKESMYWKMYFGFLSIIAVPSILLPVLFLNLAREGPT